jgi:6,7-dimethyl-8-ribityllumazine synthase
MESSIGTLQTANGTCGLWYETQELGSTEIGIIHFFLLGMKHLDIKKLDGSGLRIAIIRTRWNPTIVDQLVQGCQQALQECSVSHIDIHEVPGAYELPFAVQCYIKEYDALIAVGVLIKGSTMHFEYICEAVSHGLMNVQLEHKKPVMFGVLTCLTEEQALERSGGKHNHGLDWGYGAVEMALLNKRSS